MTYAILQHGGRQYRVTAGDRLLVDRLPADVGSMVALEPVLLVGNDGGKLDVGSPAVDGVRVAAEVISHRRGRKLRIFTYKPKKRRRRTMGFRADLTELRVAKLLAKGEAIPEAGRRAETAEKSEKKPRSAAKPAVAKPVVAEATTETAEEKPKPARKAAAPKAAKPKTDVTEDEAKDGDGA